MTSRNSADIRPHTKKIPNSISELQRRIRGLELENSRLRQENFQMVSSTSWLVTAPLRAISQYMPTGVKAALRCIAHGTLGTHSLPRRIISRICRVSGRIWHVVLATGAIPDGRAPLPSFDARKAQRWILDIRRYASKHNLAQNPSLVSIVMPTKNRATRITAAIDSVLSQTYSHWELIIVDDHSSDTTQTILEKHYQDPRIKIILNSGSGVCDARNEGLRVAQGSIIAYLDSDNAWLPEYLELMTYEMRRHEADCCYAILKCINQEPVIYRHQEFDFYRLKTLNFIDLNVFMHKRDLCNSRGTFDNSLKRMVDWDLIIRLTENSKVSFAYFVGAEYDAGTAPDRITNSERLSYLDVVRNKHWIDWKSLRLSLEERDPSLISIITCVYGQHELTEQCLKSLYTHEAGTPFELIVVNNGSDFQTKALLARWSKLKNNIQVITNPANFNFALGNNIGFAHSRGSRVVFLNNDTEVSPGWLSSLVRPLQQMDVKGAQPKLLFANGTIQCVGVVFSNHSPIGYPIYSTLSGSFFPSQQSRRYPAITAACMAVRASDFASIGGFDPIFTNGQEDIDLCLRLGRGEPSFMYVADSIVMHHESQTPGRGNFTEQNRALFVERWGEAIQPCDHLYYARDGIQVEDYVPDDMLWEDPNYTMWRPTLRGKAIDCSKTTSQLLQPHTIALKIGCPHPELRESWGDYHFAVGLAAALLRRGIKSRIDFLNDWQQAQQPGDINLVFRGLSQFRPQKDAINLLWLISHPELATLSELQEFDHVFVASEGYTHKLQAQGLDTCSILLQCTDISRFHPRVRSPNSDPTPVFVANSRKVLRRVAKHALAEQIPIAIYGNNWDGLVPAELIKAEKVLNIDLPDVYANAPVVLNDHWDDMREHGFVSNRIFDVLACGVPIVTDRIEGIPQELLPQIFFFDENEPLGLAIENARAHRHSMNDVAFKIQTRHSFDNRADEIIAKLEKLLG